MSEWVAADPRTGQSDLHLVENVEQLGASALQGLFGLLNELRSHPGGALLATGLEPPASLPVRDDVASRLSWGLVTRCIALDEHDRGVALQRLATERGVSLSPDLVPYLLTHTARDMRALTGLFDRLDRFALARNRALTLPLLREYLQTSLRASGADF